MVQSQGYVASRVARVSSFPLGTQKAHKHKHFIGIFRSLFLLMCFFRALFLRATEMLSSGLGLCCLFPVQGLWGGFKTLLLKGDLWVRASVFKSESCYRML